MTCLEVLRVKIICSVSIAKGIFVSVPVSYWKLYKESLRVPAKIWQECHGVYRYMNNEKYSVTGVDKCPKYQ